MESIVVAIQFVSGRCRISSSLASSVPSRSARGNLDSASGRNRYMIARALSAMLTLVALATYKAAESQRAESFDGFALVDKAGNIQKPTDYRNHYQVLGTYAVLDPKGNQMHFTMPLPARPSITTNMEGLPMERCW